MRLLFSRIPRGWPFLLFRCLAGRELHHLPFHLKITIPYLGHTQL